MTDERRRQLEEMARTEVDKRTWPTRADVHAAEDVFVAGAEAGYALGKAEGAAEERERIEAAVADGHFLSDILNPPEEAGPPCYCAETNPRNCPEHQNSHESEVHDE